MIADWISLQKFSIPVTVAVLAMMADGLRMFSNSSMAGIRFNSLFALLTFSLMAMHRLFALIPSLEVEDTAVLLFLPEPCRGLGTNSDPRILVRLFS